ncbi:hypothetical protein K456DRAFT_766180 [Colletotrichum gloeosporioides 23]|nr:hypothetical protein K456DRAFT_766180 [Colletotrichum gloeosporioides 23]
MLALLHCQLAAIPRLRSDVAECTPLIRKMYTMYRLRFTSSASPSQDSVLVYVPWMLPVSCSLEGRPWPLLFFFFFLSTILPSFLRPIPLNRTGTVARINKRLLSQLFFPFLHSHSPSSISLLLPRSLCNPTPLPD